MNAMLRGVYNKQDSEKLRQYAEVIAQAIKKHPLEQNIICYRGMDENLVEGLMAETIFTIDQFVSTSVVESKALRKRFRYVIYAPIGTNGAYIEELSFFPRQREFLINKNVKYKFLSIEGAEIRLEVQP